MSVPDLDDSSFAPLSCTDAQRSLLQPHPVLRRADRRRVEPTAPRMRRLSPPAGCGGCSVRGKPRRCLRVRHRCPCAFPRGRSTGLGVAGFAIRSRRDRHRLRASDPPVPLVVSPVFPRCTGCVLKRRIGCRNVLLGVSFLTHTRAMVRFWTLFDLPFDPYLVRPPFWKMFDPCPLRLVFFSSLGFPDLETGFCREGGPPTPSLGFPDLETGSCRWGSPF